MESGSVYGLSDPNTRPHTSRRRRLVNKLSAGNGEAAGPGFFGVLGFLGVSLQLMCMYVFLFSLICCLLVSFLLRLLSIFFSS